MLPCWRTGICARSRRRIGSCSGPDSGAPIDRRPCQPPEIGVRDCHQLCADGQLSRCVDESQIRFESGPSERGCPSSEHSARERETWKAAALPTELLPPEHNVGPRVYLRFGVGVQWAAARCHAHRARRSRGRRPEQARDQRQRHDADDRRHDPATAPRTRPLRRSPMSWRRGPGQEDPSREHQTY